MMAAPLDIFLLRSHALPLPYLFSPSITFLVYISPFAYLYCLRNATGPATKQPNLPYIDIPLDQLRSHLPEIPKGITMATLSVMPLIKSPLFTSLEPLPGIANRPTFHFCAQGADIRHVFPGSGAAAEVGIGGTHHLWTLDFTDGGKCAGIVMSQSQMRDIELLITPLGELHADLDDVGIFSFNGNSWVDLLVKFPESSRAIEGLTLLTVPSQNDSQA
jgi:hypothetical protein